MSAVDGVGKGGVGAGDAAKKKAKSGAFQAVQQAAKPQTGGPVAKKKGEDPEGEPAGSGSQARSFQVAKPEPIRSTDAPQQAIRPELQAFTQGMVQAADAAAMPGPTTDGDLLPRESVSGLFVRDFVLQGAVALGRPPLGEDEAARIVIEKHIAGTPGLYYDAAVETSGPDTYLVKLHRLDTNPPFLPDPNAEATYKIDRRTWQIDEMG